MQDTIKELATLNQIFNIEKNEARVRSGPENSFPFHRSAKGQRGTRTLLRRKTASLESIRQSINSRLSRVFLKEA